MATKKANPFAKGKMAEKGKPPMKGKKGVNPFAKKAK
jgi:hypothetical protein